MLMNNVDMAAAKKLYKQYSIPCECWISCAWRNLTLHKTSEFYMFMAMILLKMFTIC